MILKTAFVLAALCFSVAIGNKAVREKLLPVSGNGHNILADGQVVNEGNAKEISAWAAENAWIRKTETITETVTEWETTTESDCTDWETTTESDCTDTEWETETESCKKEIHQVTTTEYFTFACDRLQTEYAAPGKPFISDGQQMKHLADVDALDASFADAINPVFDTASSLTSE